MRTVLTQGERITALEVEVHGVRKDIQELKEDIKPIVVFVKATQMAKQQENAEAAGTTRAALLKDMHTRRLTAILGVAGAIGGLVGTILSHWKF